jgi:hypothetical protein
MPGAPGGAPGKAGNNPMFDMLDSNKDGKVSEQEFFAPHDKRFQALDSNGDLNLTKEEFARGMPSMGPGGGMMPPPGMGQPPASR